MSEDYQKAITDRDVKIDLLRKALVTCKADWVKALFENKRLHIALKTAEGLMLIGQTVRAYEHIQAVLEAKK